MVDLCPDALKEDKGGSCHTCCTQLRPPALSPAVIVAGCGDSLDPKERCTQLVLFDVNGPHGHTQSHSITRNPRNQSVFRSSLTSLFHRELPVLYRHCDSAQRIRGRTSRQGTNGFRHRRAPMRRMMDSSNFFFSAREFQPTLSVYGGPATE